MTTKYEQLTEEEKSYWSEEDFNEAWDYGKRTCTGQFPMELTEENAAFHGAFDFLAGVKHTKIHYHHLVFELYNEVKSLIGKIGYNNFIHSKEVEEYRAWLRNDRYKHRIEWFEKNYPNGLYYKDEDGNECGVSLETKKFLAEADAAFKS